MRILLSILTVLCLVSCNDMQTKQVSKFFDFQAYFENEIEKLSDQKLKLNKVYSFNGKKEESLVDSVDWSEELKPFIIDINKPAWITEIKLDTISNQEHGNWIVYGFKNKKIPFETIKVGYQDSSLTRIGKIFIVYSKTNVLFKGSKILAYFPGKGYSIKGTQVVEKFDSSNYFIDARIIHP